MIHTAYRALLTIAAVATLVLAPHPAQAKTIDRPTTDQTMMKVLPACEYEDSANCSWDASTAGNGWGFSFYDIGGTTHFLNPTLNRWWHADAKYDFVSDHEGLADALAEGEGKVNGDDNWEDCLVLIGDTTEVICDDGTHLTS